MGLAAVELGQGTPLRRTGVDDGPDALSDPCETAVGVRLRTLRLKRNSRRCRTCERKRLRDWMIASAEGREGKPPRPAKLSPSAAARPVTVPPISTTSSAIKSDRDGQAAVNESERASGEAQNWRPQPGENSPQPMA